MPNGASVQHTCRSEGEAGGGRGRQREEGDTCGKKGEAEGGISPEGERGSKAEGAPKASGSHQTKK